MFKFWFKFHFSLKALQVYDRMRVDKNFLISVRAANVSDELMENFILRTFYALQRSTQLFQGIDGGVLISYSVLEARYISGKIRKQVPSFHLITLEGRCVLANTNNLFIVCP